MCAGVCVSLLYKIQKSATLFSTEAEYVAMADELKEAIFLRYLRSFIFVDRDGGCTLVKEQHRRSAPFGQQPSHHPNSEHMDIVHHFIRERVAREAFKVVDVPSELQHADFLT